MFGYTTYSSNTDTVDSTLRTKEIADKLIPLMEACQCDICKQLLEFRHSLVKKGAAEDERRASSLAFPSCSSVVEDSQWIFGGDGWGYDIGFGGGAAHRRRRAAGVRLPHRLPPAAANGSRVDHGANLRADEDDLRKGYRLAHPHVHHHALGTGNGRLLLRHRGQRQQQGNE